MSWTRKINSLLAAGAFAAVLFTGAPTASATTNVCLSHTCILDARTGAHTTFDRLVFDLGGPDLPLWTSTVTTSNAYDTQDNGIRYFAVTGSSYLTIHLTSTDASTYTTANPLDVALPSLKGVQMYGDFEGYVDYVVALDNYSSYQIFTLTNPNRLVVDVYH